MQDKIREIVTKLADATVFDTAHVQDGHVMVTLKVDPKQGTDLENMRQMAERNIAAALKREGVDFQKVTVVLTADKKPETTDTDMAARPIAAGMKKIIAVASGKGGVGKSTVAANLAVALAAKGVHVGLVDADIYGPSQHRMMGVRDVRVRSTDDKRLIPLDAHGLKMISIGSMVDEDQPMIWRGPMLQTAVTQFFRDVDWGDVDTLIVDLPPGTGDVQMTMAQKIPVTGAVIVSTPQDIALIDARKAVAMFKKMKVPILGLIENMSLHTCSNCGHSEEIFGHGGAEAAAGELGIPFLGALPLDIDIRLQSDAGTPIALHNLDHPAADLFAKIADQI